MNWGKFKDPLLYMCLACCVVMRRPLTQEVNGSYIFFYKYFVTEFSKNIQGKLKYPFFS